MQVVLVRRTYDDNENDSGNNDDNYQISHAEVVAPRRFITLKRTGNNNMQVSTGTQGNMHYHGNHSTQLPWNGSIHEDEKLMLSHRKTGATATRQESYGVCKP